MAAAAAAEAVALSSSHVRLCRGCRLMDDDLLPAEADLLYEEELIRTPYSLKLWWRYLEARKDAPSRKRQVLFERALHALPGSYKLWSTYLRERLELTRGLPAGEPAVESLNNTFERALVTMHKMPCIWELFLRSLLDHRLVTRTRRACDRALAALPVTQHDRVWTLFLAFVRQDGVPVETALRVYRRYLKIEPGHAEEYIEFLKARELWNEAALRLADVVNNDVFVSLAGKSKHQLWLELCDIITKHPAEVTSLPVEAILRGGVRKFTDEVGRLWTSLADFYIRRGLFEKARDVYEEGLATVMTVRDFSVVFDAYTQFEESVLAAKMEAAGDEPAAAADDEDGRDFLLLDTGDDVDLRLARLEHLMQRRPELLSSIMLRQNPHNVHEWVKRVGLFEGDATRQVLTFTEAVKTVNPQLAVGRLHTLWIAFARFYEVHEDVANARAIFERATAVRFKAVEDLATVWCEWAEMELRHKHFPEALRLMQRATAVPAQARGAAAAADAPVQARLHRSLKLWSFYCDLEESIGTLEGARRVYNAMLELRVATPQTVLNYAALLQESKHWEDSFSVYERGVNAFRYPHVRDIWLAYLSQFVARYGGKKLERARDLYEQALAAFPAEAAKPLYLAYVRLEEEHGLARRAMDIFARCAASVPDSEKLAVFDLYATHAMEAFGVDKVRSIYQTAVEGDLPDGLTRELCTRFAALERKHGEIDRARSLYIHASQFSNPSAVPAFWEEWNSFEVRHGNEDTFREMLRIKRSVAASYSNAHYSVDLQAGAAALAPAAEAGEQPPSAGGDAFTRLEAQVVSEGLRGFVSAGTTGGAGIAQGNAEEIDLDMAEEEEGPEPEQRAVPAEVFGSLAAAAPGDGDEARAKRPRID